MSEDRDKFGLTWDEVEAVKFLVDDAIAQGMPMDFVFPEGGRTTQEAQWLYQERMGHPFVFGVKPSPPDPRDKHVGLLALPKASEVDLRPLCSPVEQQESLGACHSADTEVLTENGFRLFSELTGEERLATVNPETTELSYEKPIGYTRYQYDGPMVCASGNTLNFKVTPNHNMLVKKWTNKHRVLNKNYEFVKASDLGWYFGVMSLVKWNGEDSGDVITVEGVPHKLISQRSSIDYPMKSWLRFLGFYLAEGTMRTKRLDKNGSRDYGIQLACVKPRERDFAIKLLEDMGLNVCKNLKSKDRVTISNKRIYSKLESYGLLGVKAPFKFVPDFVFNQSAENISEFICGHFMGDGCKQIFKNGNSAIAHYTSSRRLADDIQRLIFLSGKSTVMSIREPRSSTMRDGRHVHGKYPEHRISSRARITASCDRKEILYNEDYSGEVFCAEVPSFHTLVTRRNGKILISGNCSTNAYAGCDEYLQNKVNGNYIDVSRLFVYYNGRELMDTVGEDSGLYLSSLMKALLKYGWCPESMWPYNVKRFKERPPDACYEEGQRHLIQEYLFLKPRDVDQARSLLALGYPIIGAMFCYSGLFSAEINQTGILPMPRGDEKNQGGHAVNLCGMSDSRRAFLVRNSWSSAWGPMGGYFWMPYSFYELPNGTFDALTIETA